MPESKIKKIADAAEMIVGGYAMLRHRQAMHVHASDRKLTEQKSAKFFVRADGSSVLRRRGDLTKSQQIGIQAYIKKNYLSMFALWSMMSSNGFFVGK